MASWKREMFGKQWFNKALGGVTCCSALTDVGPKRTILLKKKVKKMIVRTGPLSSTLLRPY